MKVLTKYWFLEVFSLFKKLGSRTMMEKYESLKNRVPKVYDVRIQKLESRLQDLLYKDSKTRIKNL